MKKGVSCSTKGTFNSPFVQQDSRVLFLFAGPNHGAAAGNLQLHERQIHDCGGDGHGCHGGDQGEVWINFQEARIVEEGQQCQTFLSVVFVL